MAWQPQPNSVAAQGSEVEYTYRIVRPLSAIATAGHPIMTFVAPGDTFDVSLGVSNQAEGSGPDAKLAHHNLALIAEQRFIYNGNDVIAELDGGRRVGHEVVVPVGVGGRAGLRGEHGVVVADGGEAPEGAQRHRADLDPELAGKLKAEIDKS